MKALCCDTWCDIEVSFQGNHQHSSCSSRSDGHHPITEYLLRKLIPSIYNSATSTQEVCFLLAE